MSRTLWKWHLQLAVADDLTFEHGGLTPQEAPTLKEVEGNHFLLREYKEEVKKIFFTIQIFCQA